MSAPSLAPQLSGEAILSALQPVLFPANPDEAALHTYAILDGAAIPELLDHLYADERPEFECLYRGDLEPDLAECAPYVVALQPEAAFTKWLLAEGWGKHWGIFALSSGDLRAMRRHFRNFLMVRNPEGKQVYFRFYDPRVLRTFLPTCNAGQAEIVLGPLASYLCEAEGPETLLSFTAEDGPPQCLPVKLIS